MDLERALSTIDVAYPAAPDLEATLADLDAAPALPSPLIRLAPALGVMLLAVALALAPVREAVADWLGIGVIRVTEVEALPPGLEQTIGDLGDPIAVEDAGSWPALLGSPDAAYSATHPDSVSFLWLARPGLAPIGDTGVGALYSRFSGTLEVPVITKATSPGTEIEIVRVNGDPAYWIWGEAHAFGYLDADDEVAIESLRLAGDTLLWEIDGVTHRLESGLPLEEAIRVAESVP